MQKVLSLIGLAKRAGRVVLGEGPSKDAARYKKAKLIIIAEDASDNTKKSITDSCKYYNVRYYMAFSKESLGHAVGNSINAAVAILDDGFAKSIEKHLQQSIDGGDVL